MIDLRSLSNPPLFPLHVCQDAVAAFRRSDPRVCAFHLETGSVVISEKIVRSYGTSDGQEFHQTTVRIPVSLHNLAVERWISMSATLTKSVRTRMQRVEQAPTSRPAAPSGTPRRSKGQS